MAKKICLYCRLQLPDTADFCPECGMPIEEAIRVEILRFAQDDSGARDGSGARVDIQALSNARIAIRSGAKDSSGARVDSNVREGGRAKVDSNVREGSGAKVDSEARDDTVTLRRTTIAKGCLYCGLQLPDTADFCPECGRIIEKGLEIRPGREGEFDYLRKEMKRKDDRIRQPGLYCVNIGPRARSGKSPKRRARLTRRGRKTTGALSTS